MEEAFDTSYFDSEPLPLTDPVQQDSELEMLKELASNVGLYSYEYKPEFQQEEGANDQENIGIMAQDLLKIPGLASCVITNPDGSLAVDGNRLALSALGYIAALARRLYGYTNANNANSIQEAGARSGTETSGTEGTTIPEESGTTNGPAVETTDSPVLNNSTTTGLTDSVYEAV